MEGCGPPQLTQVASAASDVDPSVVVAVLAYNSEDVLPICLDAALRQTYSRLRVIGIDNGSRDSSLQILHERLGHDCVIDMQENSGYSRAYNNIFNQVPCDFFVCVNPDIVMEPEFVSALIGGARRHQHVGSLCGCVWQIPKSILTNGHGADPLPRETMDTSGMFPQWLGMEFDRDQSQPPMKDYLRTEHMVFGASGCAAMYRRTALEDIAIDGEVFDEDFFMLFEDVDVAWRLQWRGWACLYVPSAVAYHARSYPGGATRHVRNPMIRRHLTRNRWLLLIKSWPARVVALKVVPMVIKDLVLLATGGIADSAARQGYADVARLLKPIFGKRRKVMRRRRAQRFEDIAIWFSRRAREGMLRPFAPILTQESRPN